MAVALVILAIILQAGAAPSPAPALKYFVISPQNDTHRDKRYNCATQEATPGRTIVAGTVILLLEETESLLKAIEVETGQTVCLKVRTKDLIPIRPIRARGGTPAPFPGKLFGIKRPQVIFKGMPSDPELIFRAIPRNRDVVMGESTSQPANPETVSGVLPSEQTLLVIMVNKDGRVSECQILHSSGLHDLDRLAEEMVCDARYEPATQDKRPVAVTLVVRFALQPYRPF